MCVCVCFCVCEREMPAYYNLNQELTKGGGKNTSSTASDYNLFAVCAERTPFLFGKLKRRKRKHHSTQTPLTHLPQDRPNKRLEVSQYRQRRLHPAPLPAWASPTADLSPFVPGGRHTLGRQNCEGCAGCAGCASCSVTYQPYERYKAPSVHCQSFDQFPDQRFRGAAPIFNY